MKMPSNTQMELLDFKTNLILKTKFDALSSVPGAYDVINFWRSLPCENFPDLRKFTQSYMYVNDPELLVQSRSRRSRTAPLFRHKG